MANDINTDVEIEVKSVMKEINELLESQDLTSYERGVEFSRLCTQHGVDENDILFELLDQ